VIEEPLPEDLRAFLMAVELGCVEWPGDGEFLSPVWRALWKGVCEWVARRPGPFHAVFSSDGFRLGLTNFGRSLIRGEG